MTTIDRTLDPEILDSSAEVAALLVATSQQAVLPRRLDEGVYAIRNAQGGVLVVETEGYGQERKHGWDLAHSDKPEFIHRNVTLLDVPSFIDYLRGNTQSISEAEVDEAHYVHGAGELELWADLDNRRIAAILDGYSGLRKHHATLLLKTSREWDEWARIDGKLLPQAEFAEFIQDHISTIGLPDAGVLVDICETLVGSTDVQWKSQQLDATGQRKFTYEEQVNGVAGAKGDLAIPTNLTLVVRPFQGSEPIRLEARFRFRLSGGAVALGVKLVEPDRILEESFTKIVDAVQDKVPVHVRIGRS